jgi:hypothetical protein
MKENPEVLADKVIKASGKSKLVLIQSQRLLASLQSLRVAVLKKKLPQDNQ